MYGYGDRPMDPEIHPGHIFELFGSRDVIGHVTIRLPMWPGFPRWSTLTMRLSGTVNEILSLEDIGVTTLTLWGHVTSSVT